MNEPTVTIPLEEYNQLGDAANSNRFLYEKINFYENRMNDLDRRIHNLECKS